MSCGLPQDSLLRIFESFFRGLAEIIYDEPNKESFKNKV